MVPLIDPCASTLPLEKTKVVDSRTEQEDLQTELSPQVTFFWVAFTSKSRAVMFGPEGSHYDYLKPIYLIFIFIFHHILILQPKKINLPSCRLLCCCSRRENKRVEDGRFAGDQILRDVVLPDLFARQQSYGQWSCVNRISFSVLYTTLTS